jgi:transcriptional regulator with XRE-family HTH domain
MTPASLAAWRERLKLSRLEAARALGLNRNTYADYEDGKPLKNGKPRQIPLYIALACASALLANDRSSRRREMPKFSAKRTVVQEVEIDVDDRIWDETCNAYKVADIILGGRLKRICERDMYSDDESVVSNAARRVNEAFQTADRIIAALAVAT